MSADVLDIRHQLGETLAFSAQYEELSQAVGGGNIESKARTERASGLSQLISVVDLALDRS